MILFCSTPLFSCYDIQNYFTQIYVKIMSGTSDSATTHIFSQETFSNQRPNINNNENTQNKDMYKHILSGNFKYISNKMWEGDKSWLKNMCIDNNIWKKDTVLPSNTITNDNLCVRVESIFESPNKKGKIDFILGNNDQVSRKRKRENIINSDATESEDFSDDK